MADRTLALSHSRTRAESRAHFGARFLAFTVLAALAVKPELPAQIPPPPQVRHATYDFTEGPTEPSQNLDEVWVDSKAMPDGTTYQVGTVEVLRTVLPGGGQVNFSESPITPAFPLLGFSQLPPAIPVKRVVVVQQVSAEQDIGWQQFFYGYVEDGSRLTNARAIAVWPADDPLNQRIAIAGESTHDWLPLDQIGSPGFASARWRGFIAVFNGDGALLWSHQFYGRQQSSLSLVGDMAVTDLSIRVENGIDVVTYCGISSCGADTNSLQSGSAVPVAAYPAPTATGGCPGETPAGGAADNGVDNWDGFVGRITSASSIPVFHAVVGGDARDGLFGIAEADENRFLVVGSTGGQGPSQTTFPFSDLGCIGAVSGPYSLGVVMQFSWDPNASQPQLALDWSQRIGRGPSTHPHTATYARDVVVQHDWDAIEADDLAVVVGTTDDDAFWNPWLLESPTKFGPQGTKALGDDGFIITCLSSTGVPIPRGVHATFKGGDGQDGLTGVQSWNEFQDHFAVLGYADATGTGGDLEVGSYWINTFGAITPTGALPGLPDEMVLARNANLGPTASYQPAALGELNAGFEFEQGGGITMDPTGRVTAVGALVGPGPTYNSTSTIEEPDLNAGRPNNYPSEAYRVVLDMLPEASGRTDGTGTPSQFYTGTPQYEYPLEMFDTSTNPPTPLGMSWFGGTTPQCALAASGNQIGAAAPALERILIDYVGPPPADDQAMTVVVDRPPQSSLVHGVVWQVGYPGYPASGTFPVPQPVDVDGTLFWMVNQAATYSYTVTNASVAYQWLLPNLPPGIQQTVSVQAAFLLANPVPGGSSPNPCVGTSDFAASPALWFTYTGQ